jgi:hypothetical protein
MSYDPQGPILAVVGSVGLAGNVEAYSTIFYVYHRYCPRLVVSGAARGIDSMAVEVAKNLGIPYQEFPPAYRAWPAYKARNMQVAQACEGLIRIVSSRTKTYGSGWTRDYAESLGIPTEQYIIQVP